MPGGLPAIVHAVRQEGDEQDALALAIYHVLRFLQGSRSLNRPDPGTAADWLFTVRPGFRCTHRVSSSAMQRGFRLRENRLQDGSFLERPLVRLARKPYSANTEAPGAAP